MTMIMKRGGAGELVSKELEISETPQLLVKADELKNISSLTISITNIYTSAESWWFSAVNSESTDGDYTDIEWKSGSGSECVYELKITDFSSYTNGIYIAGVSSTVTVKVTAEEGSASQDTPSNTETPSDTDTSSGGNSGTENGDEEESSTSIELYSESITLSASSLTSLIESSKLSSIDIKTLTITVYSFEYSGSGDWWVNIDYGTNWSDDKLGKDSGTWSDDKKGWSWTITDAALIAKFKSSGIYIAGNNDATATVTVSYQ